MRVQLADLMRAVDDLEEHRRKVYDSFEPLWDEDERRFTRALAILHALVKELDSCPDSARLIP